MAQNDAKDAPKRLQEAPKRPKKVIPNRKTKKGPNRDDPKTALDPRGARFPKIHVPQGAHLGPHKGIKSRPPKL